MSEIIGRPVRIAPIAVRGASEPRRGVSSAFIGAARKIAIVAAIAPAIAAAVAPPAHAQDAPARAPRESSSARDSKTPRAELQVRRQWVFEEEGARITIDNEFSGARVNACERVGPLQYRIVSGPENTPINPSPWYAFRVTSSVEREVTIRIDIATSNARPRPYLSRDGKDFTRAEPRDYEGGAADETAARSKDSILRVRVGPTPTFVASNHMVGVAEIEAWTDAIAKRLGVEAREIGRTSGDRAIRALEFGATDARESLVVIGRQHPPEVSGTVGLFRFVEAVAADTEVARAFRARYRVLCVPLVNPDGVHEGQWRSTLGAVDANRDWGPFTQPETRAVRDAIVAFANGEARKPRLLLDFHATSKDILYVPPDETPLDPPHFAKRWIAAISARFPDYLVEQSATNNVKEWTFKRWAFETFGAPGITYELGGSTPHARIERIVTGAAEEAMRLLLEARPPAGDAASREKIPATAR